MSTTQWEAVLTMPVAEDRDHIQGPADAAVTLVQYGDHLVSRAHEEKTNTKRPRTLPDSKLPVTSSKHVARSATGRFAVLVPLSETDRRLSSPGDDGQVRFWRCDAGDQSASRAGEPLARLPTA